ncbi:MAG: PAC2 family protein [Dehalococcoidia bacterium]|nr:PAC2 family protein [Dehalococcoidia bacterium]
MDFLRYYEEPGVTAPVFLFAFAGWSDAAESATHALRYLVKRLEATKFAEVDPEEFYDFTQVRPHTGFDEEGARRITWPANEFFYARRNPEEEDLVIFVGVEPSLKWRTFTSGLVEVIHRVEASRVLHLGALLDAVPHTRDTRITGTATSPELQELLRGVEVRRSRYTGPTGITGVLMDALRREKAPSVSIWGHAPHYLQVAPNPKVSLRLLQVVERLLHVDIDVDSLNSQGANFERRVRQALSNEPGVIEYIHRLESQWDSRVGGSAGPKQGVGEPGEGATLEGEMPQPDEAVRAFEEFLRRSSRRGGDGEG